MPKNQHTAPMMGRDPNRLGPRKLQIHLREGILFTTNLLTCGITILTCSQIEIHPLHILTGIAGITGAIGSIRTSVTPEREDGMDVEEFKIMYICSILFLGMTLILHVILKAPENSQH